jgi:hypothetical protein
MGQRPVAETRGGVVAKVRLGVGRPTSSYSRKMFEDGGEREGIERLIPDAIVRNFVHRTAVSASGIGGESWAKGGQKSV